jgi:regulatory protein
MHITALEPSPRRKSRLSVFLDGVAAGDISRVTARQEGLRVGVELPAGRLDEIVAAERRREALQAAVTMLARRPRSEREVRTRLKRRKLDPGVIDETVGRLRAARLLDDAEYARAFAESRARTSPRGRRLLERELRASGVGAEVAAEAVTGLSDEEAAYRLASGRMRPLARLDRQAFRARLAGLLQRRGFGWEVTRRTVERCWAELGREGRPDDERDDEIED